MSLGIGHEGTRYIGITKTPKLNQKHFPRMKDQTKSQSKPTTNPAAREKEATLGKDEMNLAEFPLTTLGTRDNREVLVYSGWVSEKGMQRYEQQWTVRAASGLGLPGEFGDRVILALLALTFRQSPLDARVDFTRYQILRSMGMDKIGQSDYERLEATLSQLVGMTIESRRAFYDKQRDKRIVTTQAFHVFDRLWIRRNEKGSEGNSETSNAEGEDADESQGYIVWSPQFWSNLQGGYIKNIDLGFYNSLSTPLARRLYRLLDKRLHHRTTCEMDIFELSGRLGQQRYPKPSQTYRKLKPSIDVLIAERYLKSAELVKHGIYTRVRFERWGAGEFAKAKERKEEKEQQLTKVKAQLGLEDTVEEKLAQTWNTVLAEMHLRLTPTVHALLVETVLVSLEDSRAVVLAPSRFAAERLAAQRELLTTLATLLEQQAGEPVTKIEFIDMQAAAGTLKTEE